MNLTCGRNGSEFNPISTEKPPQVQWWPDTARRWAEVLDEHGHAHDPAQQLEGALRQELRPHHAWMPLAEVPTLKRRGRGVQLDGAGVQERWK